jgi:hypothetical protein
MFHRDSIHSMHHVDIFHLAFISITCISSSTFIFLLPSIKLQNKQQTLKTLGTIVNAIPFSLKVFKKLVSLYQRQNFNN